MIRSFKDTNSERIWLGKRSRLLPADIQDRAFARLKMIDAAASLDDLRFPPSTVFMPSLMIGWVSIPFQLI